MATKLYNQTTVGTTFPEWLDSEHYRFVTGGVTIDAALVTAVNGRKVVASGAILEKQGSGKWGPAAATPAANAHVALLWERVDVTDGDVSTGALDHARVIIARLPAAPTAGQRTANSQITYR
jgi:hypothetical protein